MQTRVLEALMWIVSKHSNRDSENFPVHITSDNIFDIRNRSPRRIRRLLDITLYKYCAIIELVVIQIKNVWAQPSTEIRDSLGSDAWVFWGNPQKLGKFKLHANAVQLPKIRCLNSRSLFTYPSYRVLMPDGLSNSDGDLLVRRLLRPRLPHDLHDYIIEGLCKADDGVHVFVVKTGGGKTGLFYGYILLLHALKDLGSSCPPLKRKFPLNPVIIVVYPTKGLEERLVMCRLGLKAPSRPKPALESPAEPRPSLRLERAWGSGFRFWKPRPRAWALKLSRSEGCPSK